jgi:hypothetical protein
MRVVRVDVEHNHRRGRICFGLCGQLSAAMSSSERHADVDLGWLFDQVALCVTVTLRCVWYCVWLVLIVERIEHCECCTTPLVSVP